MKQVAILMTVHNRREKTLACLHNCYHQIDALKGEGKYSFTIWLVDDGSTDGTSESVAELYSRVNIIKGDGSLYWNQGMRLAWEQASVEKPDFYLWLKDDTVLKENAIANLLETSEFLKHKAIVVGSTMDSHGRISYGGRTRNNSIVDPDATIPVPCYLFDGNIVLIPEYVHNILGNLDGNYTHRYGDHDYGVRAAKKNITRAVAAGVLGECEGNPSIPEWRDKSYPMGKRFQYLFSPKGRPTKEQFRFDCRNKGWSWALCHGCSLFCKTIFAK